MSLMFVVTLQAARLPGLQAASQRSASHNEFTFSFPTGRLGD